MSISTKHGDRGETGLVGGRRVTKSDLRVEAYGTVDELGSSMGFARSLCANARVGEETKRIQKELFTIGAVLAAPGTSEKKGGPGQLAVTQEMVDALTKQVNEIEAMEGILGDWALPGEDPVSAAFDVARTVCRRAERAAVRLRESGEPVDDATLAYLNRLSDLLWLFGRLVEKDRGVDASLRNGSTKGPKWSRAW